LAVVRSGLVTDIRARAVAHRAGVVLMLCGIVLGVSCF